MNRRQIRRAFVRLFSLVAFCALAATLAAAQATDWQKITIPPLHTFRPAEPRRIQLPNGMVIFLQEDHELPLIDGVARIRGGSRSEPAAKIGLTDIYGEAWRTGGTKAQTGDQLDDFLELRAAKVESSGNADSTVLSWTCLKGDFEDVFKVFNDLLRSPEFREEKIDIARKGEYDAISRRNDELDGIAGREAVKLAYGPKNPYAVDAEYSTVAAITRQDLLDWHHRYVQPSNIILGVVGDFDSAAMEARLRQAFGSWAKGPAAPPFNVPFEPAKPGYYLVEKTDVNQSDVRMVELGVKRDNPDYFAIQVFNEAFGGGFSSRLFNSLRRDKGLAYAVGGGIGTAFDHPGIVRLSIGTKSQSTIEAIQGLYGEIANLASKPITQDEIKRAQDSILNSFIFNLDSPDKVLRERMAYEFYGYPLDFLDRYRTGIEKVTLADVARIPSRYLHKDKLAVLVVGNPAEFDKPLDSLGPVQKIDITIPPMPGESEPSQPNGAAAAPPSTPKPTASNPEGKALAAKVAEALGGEARLKTIKSVRSSFSLTGPQGGQPTPLTATIVYPDRMHVEIESPQGTLTIVVTPDAGFMSIPGNGLRDLPAAQRNDTSKQIRRDIIYVAQHASDPAFIFNASGSEKVGDVQTRIVDVSGPGVDIRWFVDPATGRILREDYEGMGQSGPFHGETDLSDWKTVDGITQSYRHANKENGKDSSVAQFTKFELNPETPASLFEKPK